MEMESALKADMLAKINDILYMKCTECGPILFADLSSKQAIGEQ